MTIRLDAVRTFGKNLKEWFRLTIPLICVIRYLSDRPIDWLCFWIGWKFLRSSASYFFEGKNNGKIEDFKNYTSRIKNENDNDLYHTRLKHFASTRNSSTNGASNLPLTLLPSAVLSDVAYYLHPRDVLSLDTVLRSGTGLRNSEDGSDSNERIRRMFDSSVGLDIWRRLWYRDYGDVLLRWKVSREAFRQSLLRSSPRSTEVSAYDDENLDSCHMNDIMLEEMLSERLNEMTGITISTTMKYFYFLFGECYIDYVLARKNTIDECYLGLHGHIFDFTDFAEFHPGLIEPILKECGGDATHYFEDLPHSSGARNIARRLCVVVDHSAIDYGDEANSRSSRSCGLEIVLDSDGSSKLKDLLRSSNTRPLPQTPSGESNRVEQNKSPWITRIVPRRPKWRRHPTVERIRTHFQQEQRRRERQQPHYQNGSTRDSHVPQPGSNSSLVTMTTELISSCSPFWRLQQSMSRVYYDPLRQEWDQWCPDKNVTYVS